MFICMSPQFEVEGPVFCGFNVILKIVVCMTMDSKYNIVSNEGPTRLSLPVITCCHVLIADQLDGSLMVSLLSFAPRR